MRDTGVHNNITEVASIKTLELHREETFLTHMANVSGGRTCFQSRLVINASLPVVGGVNKVKTPSTPECALTINPVGTATGDKPMLKSPTAQALERM